MPSNPDRVQFVHRKSWRYIRGGNILWMAVRRRIL